VRITEIETFLVGTDWRNFTICRVHTDTGLTGLGESRIPNHPHALEAYAQAAKRHIVGRDPFDIESLVMRMRRDD
jgi:galactonate dehydratase